MKSFNLLFQSNANPEILLTKESEDIRLWFAVLPAAAVEKHCCETTLLFPYGGRCLRPLPKDLNTQIRKKTKISALNRFTSAAEWRHPTLTLPSIMYSVNTTWGFKLADRNLLCQTIPAALCCIPHDSRSSCPTGCFIQVSRSIRSARGDTLQYRPWGLPLFLVLRLHQLNKWAHALLPKKPLHKKGITFKMLRDSAA